MQVVSVRGAWTAPLPNASVSKFTRNATIGGFDYDWLAIGWGECNKVNYASWIESALWFDPAYFQFVDQTNSDWDYDTCFLTRPYLRLDLRRTAEQHAW